MALQLDASAQSTIQRAVDDIKSIAEQNKDRPLSKEQSEKLLDGYSTLSSALSKDPSGSLSLASSEASLAGIITEAVTHDVTGNEVQSMLTGFIDDMNKNGVSISATTDKGPGGSIATPLPVADMKPNDAGAASTSGVAGDSSTISGLQAQIVALEAKLPTAKAGDIAAIRAQEQALMVQQQAIMNGGAADVTVPSAGSMQPPVLAPVTEARVDNGSSDANPPNISSAGEQNISAANSADSSPGAMAATQGSYGGSQLTQKPGPGEAIAGIAGEKAYGPSPQGPQPGRPYPYIGKQYSGPASNFPDSSKWMDFDTLFSKASVIMKAHGDTDSQIAMIKSSIEKESSVIDPRVILCLIMKESGGNLGVGNTTNASGTASTGLLQADGGTGFNPQDPQGSIDKMIKDGIEGVTPTSTSIMSALKATGGNIYEALRGYNSGLYGGIKNLDNLSHSPASGDVAYVSNFANYLTDGNFV
ncbi:MAG: hypothetical protein EOO38_00695 [Cytophagaceae bacterium]|nr:MAG: hypothetical protein EOO38_00695 [Cytophagaceae bacterium]